MAVFFSNLSNWKEEAWEKKKKKMRALTGFESVTERL